MSPEPCPTGVFQQRKYTAHCQVRKRSSNNNNQHRLVMLIYMTLNITAQNDQYYYAYLKYIYMVKYIFMRFFINENGHH